ncbi:histamine N-methyltransferase [Silurus meridionalis]|nr:histamine N-methyltransferase [Silurus meridionalis]
MCFGKKSAAVERVPVGRHVPGYACAITTTAVNQHIPTITDNKQHTGQSGWGRLWRTYRAQLCKTDISQCVTTGDIRNFLDAEGIPYQSHTLVSQMDITECFTAGDEKGELLLDFLTEVLEFSKNASPELNAGVLELLKHPECSREVDGRIIFNNNLEALVLSP